MKGELKWQSEEEAEGKHSRKKARQSGLLTAEVYIKSKAATVSAGARNAGGNKPGRSI